MLRYMERSTIYYLKQKGWSNVQIAAFTGHHRDTIARVLREEVEKKPKTRERPSAVAVFDAQIREWLEQGISVIRMLELARANTDHPYTGGETAFYDYVRKVRHARQQTPRHLALRFEGVPGEFLQIDWGEVRELAFTKEGMEPQTRYFFAARLKYSRYMYVSFHSDMREETLLRCIIACFAEIDGVPWAVVTDNMKTAVLGRDDHHEPIWNPAYQKLAVEFKFHPDVCAPASGNQKGAVENLVKFVKGNFLAGRTFYDDADLAEQCRAWLRQVNTERPSDATGSPPAVLLAEEQPKFGPLPGEALDYGFFDCVVVSREGLVAIETNRYSVPAHLMGRVLTARIHQSRIELFANGVKVREQPVAAESGSRPGTKVEVTWELRRPGHDAYLVAVSSGPGVSAPSWAIARPYQPTSRAWTPRVLGIANPIYIDGDADGMWTSPKRYAERLVARALAMDGTSTGEHGVGQGKMGYLAAEHGEPALAAMRAIKHALDPHGIMNPGKIVAMNA